MTKKEIKKQEEYLEEQSEILNTSLDFWQKTTLEQMNWIEHLEKDGKKKGFENDFSDEAVEEAGEELNYCMLKLQWEQKQMDSLDYKIKTFLKKKNK